jgi:CRISPR-associated endonuclease Csn1
MDDEDRVYLGVTIGIGSIGWALATDYALLGMGVRTFDVPETAKTRTPSNQVRRVARGMRRVIRRRRQRMAMVRSLFAAHGLIETDHKDALAARDIDPWRVRAEGLDRRLTGPELAVALGHIAKHRGFKSNSKRDNAGNAKSEASQMLAAIATLQEITARYRSVGEAFWKAPDFQAQKRNRNGSFLRTVLRADLEAEARLLTSRQMALGNTLATWDLHFAFAQAAFFQRPLGDHDDKVGFCPFEPAEKRASKYAPSFELFRFLSRLTTLRVAGQPLAPADIAKAARDFGAQQGMTFKRLRSILGLPPDREFKGVQPDQEAARDVATRSGKMAAGTVALRRAVGEHEWARLSRHPATLDDIAALLTFRDDTDRIRAGLQALNLDHTVYSNLLQGVAAGAFSAFRGAGHISAKACRALIPHLRQGMSYFHACEAAGYDATQTETPTVDSIANPIARKTLGEALKQVRVVIHEHGHPTHIHVELNRDVGKSVDERREIEYGIERRTKEKARLREEFAGVLGQEPAGAEDLLRYELWKEQNGRCLYTDTAIPPDAIVASDNRVQVSHILPWSRSADDSYSNKTLCWAKAAQEKRDRTPCEWFGDEPDRWEMFKASLAQCHTMKPRKKRNLALEDADIIESLYERNLGDRRYAARVLLAALKRDYPATSVMARPRALTSRLRRAWGIHSLKHKPGQAPLEDDRFHALDAVIVALTTNSMLQRLTMLFQEAERRGLPADWYGIGQLYDLFAESGIVPKEFAALRQPWGGFRCQCADVLAGVTVSRPERCRARGEAHAATISRVCDTPAGAVVYERKPVEAMTQADIPRIKECETSNRPIADSIKAWIAAGRPKDKPPLSAKGDAIKKVQVVTNKKVSVWVRGGTADRGEITRVDVFRRPNKNGTTRYYMVPIYPHQVADRQKWPTPPNAAITASKPEAEWPIVDASFEFLWSLYAFSWVTITRRDGVVVEGYFRGANRATASIAISAQHSNAAVAQGIGVKTLADFTKHAVDRLGNRHPVAREHRTWHGAACT